MAVMLSGAAAQQRRRPGPPQTMGRGRGGRGRGRGRGQRPMQNQARVARQQMPPSGVAQPSTTAQTGSENQSAPSLSQITMVQARNLNQLRELVEDLAKGVLDLSKVVGKHTGELEDFKSRIESIETELGAEIDYDEDNYDDAEYNDEQPEQQLRSTGDDNNDAESELSDNAEENS